MRGWGGGWGPEDWDLSGSRQRRENAATPPQCTLQPSGPPEALLEPFNTAVPWKGWGRCQHRKLIYRSGAAGSGMVTEGETEGLHQCRDVRNGAEVERRESEAENEPRALSGSTSALSSL